MDGWKTSFHFGMVYFQGLLLLVSGSVVDIEECPTQVKKGWICTKPVWGIEALGMRPGVLLQFLKRPTLPTGAPGNGRIAPWLAIG